MKTISTLLLLVAAASAQTTVIQGEVVRKGSAEPQPGVRVAALCGPQPPSTTTDVAGRFHLSPGTAPQCELLLTGPGILQRRFPISIDPQDLVVNVKLMVTPQAVITGKVVDENGWPMTGLVTAVRDSTAVKSTLANDLGEYRLGKLPPGRYYIRVRPVPGVASWGERCDVTWYPAAPDLENARLVELREGQEARGIDVRLGPRRGVEVRGRVTFSGGAPKLGAIEITREDLQTTTFESAPIAPDGAFTLRHIPPGKHTLVVVPDFSGDGSPPKYSAYQPLEVGGQNVEGVVVTVAETPVRVLKGVMVSESGTFPPDLRIFLQRSGYNYYPVATIEPSGAFTVAGMWPGRYNLTLNANAKSITLNGKDISGRSFEYDGGDAQFRIDLGSAADRTPVLATILHPDRTPAVFASVRFVRTGSEETVTIAASQKGDLRAALAPGAYRVYVTEDDTAAERELAPIAVVAGRNPPLTLTLPGK